MIGDVVFTPRMEEPAVITGENEYFEFYRNEGFRTGRRLFHASEVRYTFKTGHVVPDEWRKWLPPGAEMDKNGILVAFPGIDPYAEGQTLYEDRMYGDAPVGTEVSLWGATWRKVDALRWAKLGANGETESYPQPLWSARVVSKAAPKATVSDSFSCDWSLDPVTPANPTFAELYTAWITRLASLSWKPKEEGRIKVGYTYNYERGTVYNAPNEAHRDFGRVVHLENGNYLAVPTRPVREFSSETEAVEWLL